MAASLGAATLGLVVGCDAARFVAPTRAFAAYIGMSMAMLGLIGWAFAGFGGLVCAVGAGALGGLATCSVKLYFQLWRM